MGKRVQSLDLKRGYSRLLKKFQNIYMRTLIRLTANLKVLMKMFIKIKSYY